MSDLNTQPTVCKTVALSNWANSSLTCIGIEPITYQPHC